MRQDSSRVIVFTRIYRVYAPIPVFRSHFIAIGIPLARKYGKSKIGYPILLLGVAKELLVLFQKRTACLAFVF